MIHKSLAVGIVFLFIITSVTPMVIGNRTETKDIDCDLEAELANLRYLCTYTDVFNENEFLKVHTIFPKNNCDIFKNYIYPKEKLIKEVSNEDFEIKTTNDNLIYQEHQETKSYYLNDAVWPMFCHDTKKTGMSQYNTSENPMEQYWGYRFKGSIWAMHPSIDNEGTIYIPGIDLLAINPNGTEKWSFDLGPGWHEFMCPVVDENGTVYLGTFSSIGNYFYAVNKDGSLKWSVSEGQLYAPPIIGNDGILYYTKGHSIVARYKNNGTLKWENSITEDTIYSSPTIGNDGTIYFGSIDEHIYAVNPNGTIKWKYDTGPSWVHGSAAIADDGTVYMGSDDKLYAFYPNNGTVKWQIESGGIWGAPALDKDGVLYVGDWDMKFSAIYPNGTIKWTYDAPGKFWFSCPAISADGTIYTGTMKYNEGVGSFIAFNPDGTVKWIEYLGVCESSPVIDANGFVYFISEYGGEDPYCILRAFGRGPLFADAGGPYSGIVGEELLLTGTVYGGNPPYTIHWDLGDGGFSNEQNPKHIYSTIGEYVVNISVTDSDGNKSYDESIVSIGYQPPSLRVLKPKHAFYFLNLMIMPFLIPIEPVIIGYINIKVTVTHENLDIERVEFYIDDEIRFTDYNLPYSWVWNDAGKYPNWHTIEIVAYDSDGKSTSEKFYVLKLFENYI